MIGVLAGYGLLAASGHGLLRLASGQRPHRAYGVLGALALSWLAGVATLAAVSTLVGVLGGRTTPLPVTAPVLGLLAVGGLLPPRRPAGAGEPAGPGLAARAVWLSDLGCGLAAAAVGVWTATIAARVPVWRNDEAAIWMVRARALSQLGRLDPRVFVETAAGYQHQEYPLLVPSLAAWGDRWAGHPSDAAAHLGQAILLAALLAVTGWATGRLAGPLPALAAVALVAAGADDAAPGHPTDGRRPGARVRVVHRTPAAALAAPARHRAAAAGRRRRARRGRLREQGGGGRCSPARRSSPHCCWPRAAVDCCSPGPWRSW